MTSKTCNEGEGSRSAARAYNRKATAFARSGQLAKAAKSAKDALDSGDARDLARADAIGKAKALGEGPLLGKPKAYPERRPGRPE